MPLTNFPGGLTSVGVPLGGMCGYDLATGNVWHVCNRAGITNGDGRSRDRPFASLADAAAAIATTNPTKGDQIIVWGGHAENVTASNVFSASLVNTGAVAFPAGTRIIGEGVWNVLPTFTFTAAASTITFANTSCTLENLVLLGPQTGTVTCAALVTLTGSFCHLKAVGMDLGSAAGAFCTTGVTIGTAATGTKITDCTDVYASSGSAVPVSWVQFTGTTGPARIQISRNNVILPLSATTGGVVDFSGASGTAPLGSIITDNNFSNIIASSTVAMKGVSGCTGTVAYNNLGITNATGGATAINTPGNWNMFQNFGGVIAKQGIAITPTSG